VAAYGAGRLCLDGACVVAACRDSKGCAEGQPCNKATYQCGDCASDAACKGDSEIYGAQFLCLAGKCVKGDCHDSSTDCTPGQLCGITKPHTCGACTTTASCTADARYGAGFVCADGKCVRGDCAASNDCSGGKDGQLCGVAVPNTCGNCAQDAQCKDDPRYKDSQTLCFTAAGAQQGRCVVNGCNNNGSQCAANAADVCCGGKCVPGACCDGDDTPCRLIGPSHTCINNTCTTCDGPTGNQYFVDPVNGNDVVATGSGKAGGAASASCTFKTVSRAIELLPAQPPAGTTITIVGVAGTTTQLLVSGAVSETLPIAIPANVKVTTSGGPIGCKPPAGKVGFRFGGAGASLSPAAGAALTIDGAATSGAGVLFALPDGASATLANVVVENTGDDGVRVTGGTAVLGSLTVNNAGTAVQKQSGVEVTAGTARFVATGGATIVIANNSEHGISVSGRGNVELLGAPSGTPGQGGGSLQVRGNAEAGLHIAQDLTVAIGQRKINDVDGLVAHANRGAGLRVRGGSRLKLRRSVLLANGGAGVLIESAAAGAAGNDVSGIDLGASGDPGKNVLQTPLGSNPNTGAGICIDLSVGVGAVSVKARGNTFATASGALDCSLATPPAKIAIAPTCGRFNVGVDAAAGTPVTVELQNCQIE
jgi:hypothetical protein